MLGYFLNKAELNLTYLSIGVKVRIEFCLEVDFMFFRKRDDEKVRVEHLEKDASFSSKPDYEAIKTAMEEHPTQDAESMGVIGRRSALRQSAPSRYDDFQMPKAAKADFEKPVYEEAYTSGSQGAPLFVKVDKYRDVLKDVHELKLYTAGIKQVLDLLHDIETIRTDANKVLRATVQRIEKTLVEVDSELLRPRGAIMSEISREDSEVGHIEGALTDLQKQLIDLKRELQSFK